MTKVQIYTIQTVEEALKLVDLGVDHIGVTPSTRGLPGEIDIETARSICDSVKDSLVTIALSVESNISLILSMVKDVKPQILQLVHPLILNQGKKKEILNLQNQQIVLIRLFH